MKTVDDDDHDDDDGVQIDATRASSSSVRLVFNVTSFFVFRRCHDRELCPNYNRDTLSVVCASSMILGLVALLSVSRCLT